MTEARMAGPDVSEVDAAGVSAGDFWTAWTPG